MLQDVLSLGVLVRVRIVVVISLLLCYIGFTMWLGIGGHAR